MPASSRNTFTCAGSHSVAKILPPTRNDARPWWSCSTASGSPSAILRRLPASAMPPLEVDRDVLGLEELLDAPVAALAAEAGLLDAPERRADVRDHALVE